MQLPTLSSIGDEVAGRHGRRAVIELAEELSETLRVCGYGGVLAALRGARREVERLREGQ